MKKTLPKFLKSEKFSLAILTFFNLILRIWRINIPSEPYLNEKYFILPAVRDILKGLGDTQPITPPSPFGKLLIAVSLKIFGDNPLGWRILPAIFTTSSVLLTYFLAKNVFKNTKLAATAAILLTFETATFVHSRSADPEAFMVTFVLAMSVFAWKLITENKLKWAFWTGLSSGVAITVKPQAAFATLAIFGFIIFFSKLKTSTKLASVSAIFFLSLACYLSIYFPLIKEQGLAGFITFHKDLQKYHSKYWPENYYLVLSKTEYAKRLPEINKYIRYPITWLENPQIPYYEKNNFYTEELVLYTYNPLIFFPVIAAFGIGILFVVKKGDRRILFLILLSSSAYFPYLISSMYKPLTYPPYYLLFGLPPLTIILSFFLEQIRKKAKFPFFYIYIALVIIVFIIYYPLLTAVSVQNQYLHLLTRLK